MLDTTRLFDDVDTEQDIDYDEEALTLIEQIMKSSGEDYEKQQEVW